jgi:hypothetical protein
VIQINALDQSDLVVNNLTILTCKKTAGPKFLSNLAEVVQLVAGRQLVPKPHPIRLTAHPAKRHKIFGGFAKFLSPTPKRPDANKPHL